MHGYVTYPFGGADVDCGCLLHGKGFGAMYEECRLMCHWRPL